MKKRVFILGGGISGLSLAWQLSRNPMQFEVSLFEAASQAGGWLGSQESGGFFFEKGPRTFKTSRSQHLLNLIDELGLKNQLIAADTKAAKRYLWMDGKLRAFPWPLCKFSIFKALLKEPWIAPQLGDESIGEFAERRFGKELAECLFDPLVLGVYGGEMQSLSIQSCFPFFKKLEEEYGSLIKGMLLKKRSRHPLPFNAPLFSLKKGSSQLIEALVSQLGDRVYLKEAAEELRFSSEGVEVFTNRGRYRGDLIVSALPPHEISRLISPYDNEISNLLSSIPMKNLHVVYMGYRSNCLKRRGFGYLIPSKEGEQVMGAIFDSAVFPQHNQDPGETRLTFMVRDQGQSQEETIEVALDAAKRHLQIKEAPRALEVRSAKQAIPQYLVGHKDQMRKLSTAVKTRFPRLHLAGNYLTGASVNDCIAQSFKLAHMLQLIDRDDQVCEQ